MKLHPILCAVLLAAACQVTPVPEETPVTPEQSFRFALETEPSPVRSCYTEAEASAVRDAVVAVYSQSGFLVHSGRPEAAVTLNCNHLYSYYVMTGDLSEEAVPGRESELLARVHRYAMDGAGGFLRYHDDWNAVPMAGSVRERTPRAMDPDGDGVILLPAERLFARMELSIEADESLRSGYTVDVRSVRVRNIALAVAPFRAETADRALVAPYEADVTSQADGNNRWILFVPENLQGDLLPGNTDPAGKTAGALSAAGFNPDLCTYIETTVDYSTEFGVGGTARYRFYPGNDNTGNFDIRRNTPYRITLTLTADGLNIVDNWKIDTSLMSDQRELELVPLTENVAQDGLAIVGCTYREAGTDRSDARWGTRPGYSVGLPAEIDGYLAGGTFAGHIRYSGIDVMCDDCDRIYPGYPEGASDELRLAWFRNTLNDDGTGVFLCTECGNDLGNAEEPRIRNNEVLPPEQQNRRTWIAVPVPAGMSAGDQLTLQAATHDGRKQAEVRLNLVRTGQLSLDLGKLPKYLAMRGSARVTGLPQGVSRVSFRLVEGTGAVTLSASGRTCELTAIGLGNVTVAVLNAADGNELGRFSFPVKAPRLSIENPSFRLHPGGDADTVDWQYNSSEGVALDRNTDFDAALFDRFLKPVFSTTGPYLDCNASTGDVWIEHVEGIPADNRTVIGRVAVRATACPEAGAPDMPAYCINPFERFPDADTPLAKIDDHTLEQGAAAQSVRIPLDGHINAASFRIRATPRLSHSPQCESMEFSLSTGNVHILTVTNGLEGRHAFGRIDLAAGIENARSHQYLYRGFGFVEVYLYGQIGGKALLNPDPQGRGTGWVSCSTMTCPEKGGSDFDDFYAWLEGFPFIHDTFAEATHLYSLDRWTWYQSGANDRYGRPKSAENPEDRPYLTRYILTPQSSGGYCYPSGEIYRVLPGETDIFFGYFSSLDQITGCGKVHFLLSFDFDGVPGMVGCRTDRFGFQSFGWASETDDDGIPYRLLRQEHGWMVFDTV